MSELRDLYQQVIIDHGRSPRHHEKLVDFSYQQTGYNPLCGDKLTVYIKEQDNIIEKASFVGCGCAISMASASLMMQYLQQRQINQFEGMFAAVHSLVMGAATAEELPILGKLAVIAGVAAYPSRVKCASLAWHTARAAISNNVAEQISTE